VMGAVTSQAAPVAGCLVRPLGVMRYTAVATPAFTARWSLPLASDRGAGRPDALAAAPVVDFDRRDDLQRDHLAASGVDPDAPPRHYVPASNDFAMAVKLGLGWGLLPGFQSDRELERGELVALAGDPIDVPLYWQQWNLRSTLLDAIAEALAAEAQTALRR
jgi:LysR family transcriptional regulator, chromosome initiation inhibitor